MGKKSRKRNRKKKKVKAISEFRKERTKQAEGHPRYFFKKCGKKYFGLGITHGKHKDGIGTIELIVNPEPKPKDKRPARIIPVIEIINEDYLSKRLPWKLSDEDKKIIIALIKELEEAEAKKK